VNYRERNTPGVVNNLKDGCFVRYNNEAISELSSFVLPSVPHGSI